MKFNLIDRIESISDHRLVAVKFVSLAEEYLADHFPTFPVLPGVMMLEAMTQAAGWLLHQKFGFSRSIVALKEARNVKYGNFVAPGHFLRVEVDAGNYTEIGGSFKAAGTVDGQTAVTARLELSCMNLGGELVEVDRRLIDHNKSRWALLKTGMSA